MSRTIALEDEEDEIEEYDEGVALPEYDFTVLRVRYDDDPVALSLLDELEKMRRLAVRYAEMTSNAEKQRDRWYKQADGDRVEATRKIRDLQSALDEKIAREVKWREIIEEVARDTGKFYDPPKERAEMMKTTDKVEWTLSHNRYDVVDTRSLKDVGWEFAADAAAAFKRMKEGKLGRSASRHGK